MKAVAVFIHALVIHPRLVHLDWPVARLNPPRRMMAIAHHQAMALLIKMPALALDVLLHFPLDGRLQCPAGTVAKDLIDRRHACQMKLKCVTVHKAYPFCPAWDAG